MTLRAIMGLLPGRAQIAGGEIVFDGEALSPKSLVEAARATTSAWSSRSR